MFNQEEFGSKVKNLRIKKGLTQKEIALKIGVSEQAVSKWENGECLPDVYNFKLLVQVLHVSADSLLDNETQKTEKIIETFKIGGACFDVVKKPETVFAGKIIYAKDYPDTDSFNTAIDSITEDDKLAVFDMLKDVVYPIYDVNLSVNFWLEGKKRAYGFVREVESENQPDGAEVYKCPESLYIRGYTDKETAGLLSKERCETWELFAYMRDYFMAAHGFEMNQNGAQELEVFDSSEHTSGYAYIPVIKAR